MKLRSLEQVWQSSDVRCVLAICPRTCLWIVFQLAYFHVSDPILFKFSPFLRISTRVWWTDGQTDGRAYGRMDGRTDRWTDGWTDGRTDGRTHPLIEMRERICKHRDKRDILTIVSMVLNRFASTLMRMWDGEIGKRQNMTLDTMQCSPTQLPRMIGRTWTCGRTCGRTCARAHA